MADCAVNCRKSLWQLLLAFISRYLHLYQTHIWIVYVCILLTSLLVLAKMVTLDYKGPRTDHSGLISVSLMHDLGLCLLSVWIL